MKKILCFLVCMGILVSVSGCGENSTGNNTPNNADAEISVEDIIAGSMEMRITDENTGYRVENYGLVSLNKVAVTDKISGEDGEIYASPTEDKKFITFEFLFENSQDKAINSDDLMDITIYFEDGEQYKDTKTLIAPSSRNPELLENVDIEKDKEVKVYCGVEVPKDYSGEGTAILDFGGKRYQVAVKS